MSQPSNQRNLWQEAFESDEITDQQRSALQHRESADLQSSEDLVQDIIRLTQAKCVDYESRGFYFRWKGKDKRIDVRQTSKKIVCSVLEFKDLIDAGLKFDPTGYGASAWTIVSIGLKLIQNDKERLEAIFDASGYLTDLLTRCAKIEKHYTDPAIAESENLLSSLVRVYVAILQYAAEVKISQKANIARRVLANFLALTGQPLQQFRKIVDSQYGNVDEWRTIMEQLYRAKESNNINEKADEMLKEVQNIVDELSEIKGALVTAEEERLLDWLSSINYSDKHDRKRKEVERNNPCSGKWFLESEEYYTWKQHPQSFLWLHGNSGRGKSCLCSTIIANLDDQCQEDSGKILAFWYFESDDAIKIDLDNVLRSLIRQLSVGAELFPNSIRRLSDPHRRRRSQPSRQQLVRAFYDTIECVNKDVFLVMDGLDEMPQTEKEPKRQDLLTFLGELVASGFPNLYLLVTSRRNKDIQRALEGIVNCPVQIDVQDRITVDLDLYLSNVLSNAPSLKPLKDATKVQIIKRLTDQHERDFLWAAVNVDELRLYHANDDKILEVLGRIPNGMQAVYEKVLGEISDSDKEIVQGILQWIAFSARPLAITEIAAAVGLNEPEDVLKICTSTLLTLSKDGIKSEISSQQRQVVRFAHTSAKEYLISESLKSFPGKIQCFFLDYERAHVSIGTYCLSYLLKFEEIIQSKDEISLNPLLTYSAKHWIDHVKAIGSTVQHYAELESRIYHLFDLTALNPFLNWLRIYDPDRTSFAITESSSPKTSSPLYYALLLELPAIAQKLMNQGIVISLASGRSGNALQLASQRGYKDIVRFILSQDTEHDAMEESHDVALYDACTEGHIDVVREILQSRIDPNKKGQQFGMSLQNASYHGFDEIVKLLLSAGADVDTQSELFGTALQAAAAGGHGRVVALLLESNAEVDKQTDPLGTALQAAIAGGHDNVKKQLLAKNAKHEPYSGILWRKAYLNSRASRSSLVDTRIDRLPLGLSVDQQRLALVVKNAGLDGGFHKMSTDLKKFLDRRGGRMGSIRGSQIVHLFGECHRHLGRFQDEGYIYRGLFFADVVLGLQEVQKDAEHSERIFPIILEIIDILQVTEMAETIAVQNEIQENEREFFQASIVHLYEAVLDFGTQVANFLTAGRTRRILLHKSMIDYDGLRRIRRLAVACNHLRGLHTVSYVEISKPVGKPLSQTQEEKGLDDGAAFSNPQPHDPGGPVARLIRDELRKEFEQLKTELPGMIKAQLVEILKDGTQLRET